MTTTAADTAIEDLVSAFVQTACEAHASVGVFRAALFSLAASEVHRMIENKINPPDDVLELANNMTTLAMTLRELVADVYEQRASTN